MEARLRRIEEMTEGHNIRQVSTSRRQGVPATGRGTTRSKIHSEVIAGRGLTSNCCDPHPIRGKRPVAFLVR